MPEEDNSTVASNWKVEVGDRILSEGHVGTVKYVGHVPPTEGVWLGIEWENPDRGKHDGSHNGTQYFQCSVPGSGSFLRPKKADVGIVFLEAVSSRYIPENIKTADVEDSLAVSCKPVEMVGAEKVARTQSSFENLKAVALHDMKISRAGDEKIADRLPNMRQLDVSKNLLPSWRELSRITTGMNYLKSLDVSENRLAIPDVPAQLSPEFCSLEELFINRCNITWEQLLMCAPMWPKLKVLHACYNAISLTRRPPEEVFQNLELLNLEGNQINSWQEALQLGHLPKLEGLILNSNVIASLSFEDARPEEKTGVFPCLKSLSLHGNKIDSWQSINELSKLRSLEELNLKRNPLVETEKASTVRGMIIARLGSLTHCNHSAVSEAERKGSEIDYLKRYHPDWLRSGGGGSGGSEASSNKLQEFMDSHPRYASMIKKYGAPETTDDSKSKSGALKSSLLELIITCPQDESKKDIKKKLPVSMDVTKVKGLIQRLFKVGVADQQLFYVSQKLPDQEIPLDNGLRDLGFFGIETGDTIIVKW